MALCRRQPKPFVGFNIGLCDVFGTSPQPGTSIPHSQIVLCAGMALLCRLKNPSLGFNVIPRRAASDGQHHPQIELG